MLIDHDVKGIASERVGASRGKSGVRTVVGPCGRRVAVLFQSVLTGGALPAGVDHAPHTHPFTDAKTCHVISHRRDTSDDLVAGHAGIGGLTPFAADGVNIGMTDAAMRDVDLYVERAAVTAFEGEGCKRCGRAGSGIADTGKHEAFLIF